MDIVIRSHIAGSFLLESEPQSWDAIVILDAGVKHTEFVAKHARQHLYLIFDDVTKQQAGKRAPNSRDIQNALAFANETQMLLVSCHAGQSRSAALAFVIAARYCGTEVAVGLLNPARHTPNPLIVQLGAEHVADPHYLTQFDAWRQRHASARFSDNLDDIEAELEALERRGAANRIVEK